MASSLDKLEANDVEDAVDRAMRYRQFDKSRVPLKLIGFWPGNRGGVGISSNQVHEVCKDIMGQKCRIQRYDHVDLVEVPEPMLTEFKRVNKTKCDDDPLMPGSCGYPVRFDYPWFVLVIFGADTPVLINDKEETTFPLKELITVTSIKHFDHLWKQNAKILKERRQLLGATGPDEGVQPRSLMRQELTKMSSPEATGTDEGVTGSDEGVTGTDEGVTGSDERVMEAETHGSILVRN